MLEVTISEMDLFLIHKVRQLRVEQSLSQVRLSILMGLAEGFVGKVENPKQRDKYSIRHLTLIAKALKCSPKDLMPEKPMKNDLVRVKMKIKRNTKANPGDQNYEIIKMEAVDN